MSWVLFCSSVTALVKFDHELLVPRAGSEAVYQHAADTDFPTLVFILILNKLVRRQTSFRYFSVSVVHIYGYNDCKRW